MKQAAFGVTLCTSEPVAAGQGGWAREAGPFACLDGVKCLLRGRAIYDAVQGWPRPCHLQHVVELVLVGRAGLRCVGC